MSEGRSRTASGPFSLAALALALAVIGGGAKANGSDDGNAGLAALKSGDYDRAIALLSRALGSGGLQGDDREFGLASRGKAYLMKRDYSAAIVDLDAARRLKPDDDDAQADLLAAVAARAPVSAIPGAPRVTADASSMPTAARQAPSAAFWNRVGAALAQSAQDVANQVEQSLENGTQQQNPN